MSGYYEDDQNQGGGFDPGTLIRAFLRRKWLFFVPFVLCLGMAYVAIKTMEPIYESFGLLHIQINQTVSRSLSEGVPRYGRSRNPDREIEVGIRNHLANKTFMESVVREYDLVDLPEYLVDRQPPGPEEIETETAKLARRLKKWTKVEIFDTHIFKIAVRHKTQDLVDKLAHAVVTHVVEEEQRTRQERVEREKEVLESQRDQFREELGSLRSRLARYQQNLDSRTVAESEINGSNRIAAGRELTDIRARAETGELGDRALLRSEATAALPAVAQLLDELGRDASLADGVDQIAALEFDLAVARADGDTRWRGLESDCQGAKAALRDALAHHVLREYNYMSPADQSSVVDYLQDSMVKRALDAAAIRLAGRITAFDQFEQRQPGQSAALDNLTRQITAAEENLSRVEREISTLELSIDANMKDIGYSITIQEEPTYAYDPVEPDKKKLAMMAVVLALGIGVGLVMMAEMFDKSFKSVDQIESTLKVKVIGSLPKAEYGPFEKMRHRRRVLTRILIVLAVAAIAAVGFLWVYPMMSS